MEVELERVELINLLNTASLAGQSSKVNLEFTPEGLKILNELEDKLIINAFYIREFFTSYQQANNTQIGVDCNQLGSLVKLVDGKTVKMEVKDDNLLVIGENTKISSPSLKLETAKPSVEFQEAPFGEVAYRHSGDIDKLVRSYSYAQISVIPPGKLRPLGVDELFFKINGSKLSLVQEEDNVEFEKTLSREVRNPSNMSIPVSSKDLIIAMRALKPLYRNIIIALSQEERSTPVLFHDSSEDRKITLAMSPLQRD